MPSKLIGYSQIQSRGIKAGAVVDLAECEQAVRQAVALAEHMAKVRVESVLLSVSAGRLQGQLIEAAADIKGGAVTAADVTRVTSTGMRHATGPRAAPCCMRCRSATRSTASRASAIPAAWWRASSAST